MQMIIQEKSVLNKIPQGLNKRQVFLLEGIRYSTNSISLCYGRLFKEIENISVEDKTAIAKYDSFYTIISDIWNMIDWTNRLTVLIDSLSTKDESIPIGDNFAFLLKTKEFRNTLQHLEERIDEHILSLNAPVWGNITWTQLIDQKLLRVYTLMAGHPREGFFIPINNPLGHQMKSSIDHITLHSVVKRPSFHIESLDLCELYQRIQTVISKMEIDLESQFAPYQQYGTFPQDMVMTLDVVPSA